MNVCNFKKKLWNIFYNPPWSECTACLKLGTVRCQNVIFDFEFAGSSQIFVVVVSILLTYSFYKIDIHIHWLFLHNCLLPINAYKIETFELLQVKKNLEMSSKQLPYPTRFSDFFYRDSLTIFLHPVFFINQFILVPLEMSMGSFIFLCFYIELLHFKMTPRYFGNQWVVIFLPWSLHDLDFLWLYTNSLL